MRTIKKTEMDSINPKRNYCANRKVILFACVFSIDFIRRSLHLNRLKYFNYSCSTEECLEIEMFNFDS